MSATLFSQVLRNTFNNRNCNGRMAFLKLASSWSNNATLSLLPISMTSSLSVLNPCNGNGRHISTSSALFAEPLKKKKKADPALIKQKEEKRRRKLEKQIRKLEKVARQLKPLDECEIPTQLIDEPKKRGRRLPVVSTDEANERWRLQKEWSQYKFVQHKRNFQLFDRIIQSQEYALAQLRLESEDLYIAACEFDSTLLPFNITGPVETPPIESYQTPDGDYTDISRKWD